MTQVANGSAHVNGLNGVKPSPSFALAARLKEGRALAQDVWSIFK